MKPLLQLSIIASLLAYTCYAAIPAITTDFPDPSLIQVDGTWYAFGSQSAFNYTYIKVQVATSTDFGTWTVTEKDALGALPAWATSGPKSVWAPMVIQRADGVFVLYFSAPTAASKGQYHCIGVATSSTVTGPYITVSDQPFACPADDGGAIDAFGFEDDDGLRYVIYKVDGNAKGNGGECSNSVPPVHATPLMLQQVEAGDGFTNIGDPVEILSNDVSTNEPLVEAPAMIKMRGRYVLFFSSGCYVSDSYNLRSAVASNIRGKYVKGDQAMLATDMYGLIGPGSVGVGSDGVHAAFHGYVSEETVGQVRAMYTATVVG